MDYSIADIYNIAIIALVFLIVDGLWLYAMKDFFGSMISKVQGSPVKIRPIPAVATYAVMTVGLYHFIVKEGRSPLQAALLGLFVYAIYEGTNYSILNDWDIKAVIYDTLWGGFLFGIVSYVYYQIRDA